MMERFKFFVLILLCAYSAWGTALSPSSWSADLAQAQAREQLEDVQRGVGPQNRNHMMFYHTQFFGDQTFPLNLKNSQIFGYTFHQKAGLSFLFDTLGITHHGLGYYFSRSGWDREDFLTLRPQADWSLLNQSQAALYLLSIPKWEFFLAAGWRGSYFEYNHPNAQQTNETDEWMTSVEYRMLDLGLIGADKLNQAHFSLNLWHTPERNQSLPKWTTWIPRSEVFYDLESYTNSYWLIQQKLWKKWFYSSFRGNESNWQSISLNVFFDETHFFGMDISALKHNESQLYGWGLKLGPLSMGYNDPDTYFANAGLKSAYFLKVGLNISTLFNFGYLSPGASGFTLGLVEDNQ